MQYWFIIPFSVKKNFFLNNYKNLLKLKKMGITKKIGISVYGVENLSFFISKSQTRYSSNII